MSVSAVLLFPYFFFRNAFKPKPKFWQKNFIIHPLGIGDCVTPILESLPELRGQIDPRAMALLLKEVITGNKVSKDDIAVALHEDYRPHGVDARVVDIEDELTGECLGFGVGFESKSGMIFIYLEDSSLINSPWVVYVKLIVNQETEEWIEQFEQLPTADAKPLDLIT